MPDKQKVSRAEAIKTHAPRERGDDSDESPTIAPTEIHLPDIPSAFGYLLGLFFSSGQATTTGQGLVPLSWQELRAFREENELDLCLWERAVLKKMSDAYCVEYSRASDPKRPAPYMPEVDEEDEKQKIARAFNIRDAVAAFRGKK